MSDGLTKDHRRIETEKLTTHTSWREYTAWLKEPHEKVKVGDRQKGRLGLGTHAFISPVDGEFGVPELKLD